jgi:nucleoside-diphosphate-sugar epimerase
MRHLVQVIGCGYLGRAAERWRAEGRSVSALTRSPARAEELRADGFEPVVGDVTEPGSLRLPEAETVLYAVGLDRTAGKPMREVYVGGLANVLAVLPRPRRFVYVSSTSVCGQTDGEEVDETAGTEPVEESGKIVLEAEQLLRAIARGDHPALRRHLRTGPVAPPAGDRGSEPIVGDADKWLNLIHVEDGAAASWQQRSEDGRGVYNVSDDRPVRRATSTHPWPDCSMPPNRGSSRPWQAPIPPHKRAEPPHVSRRPREELGVTPDTRATKRV